MRADTIVFAWQKAAFNEYGKDAQIVVAALAPHAMVLAEF